MVLYELSVLVRLMCLVVPVWVADLLSVVLGVYVLN